MQNWVPKISPGGIAGGLFGNFPSLGAPGMRGGSRICVCLQPRAGQRGLEGVGFRGFKGVGLRRFEDVGLRGF